MAKKRNEITDMILKTIIPLLVPQFCLVLAICSHMMKSNSLGMLHGLELLHLLVLLLFFIIYDHLEYLCTNPISYHEDAESPLVSYNMSATLSHPTPNSPTHFIEGALFFPLKVDSVYASSLIKFEIDDVTKKDTLGA